MQLTPVTLGVLIIAVLACVVVWVMARRLYNLVEAKFREWEAKIQGKYEEIDSAKNQMFSTTEKERKTYENRVTELETRITGINTSLSSISNDAVAKVKAMSDVIQPVISMFRTPQTAGIEYAEAELDVLLKTHLGDGLYERKPRFLASGNETVDFIIKLPDCVIPVDSKFPEAVYRAWVDAADESEQKARWRLFRDAVIRQLENTSKYIRPKAGTTDYALLFLPSDVIWQQAFLVNKWYGEENTILRKSQEVSVFGCSVQTLMPYLGLLRLGLRNLKISEDVKAVQRQIDQLKILFKRFTGDWGTLRTHLQNAYNSLSNAEKAKGSFLELERAIENLASHELERAAPPPNRNWPQETVEMQKEANQL